MKTAINLSIANPCSEKWENFTTTEHGGFCSSCTKVVVDFTKMSDDETVQFFLKKPSHTCGRFRNEQLRTYSTSSAIPLRINPGFTLLKAGFVSLLILLASKPSSAQIVTEKVKTEKVEQKKNRQAELPTETEHLIKGIVTSSDDGSSISGVNIVLKGTPLGIITNAEGRFEFPKKLKEGDVLLFSFIGSATEEFTVPKQLSDSFEIKMKMDLVMLGEVAVNQIYDEPKTSGLRRWWTKLKSAF